MSTPNGIQPKKFHPNARRKVVAAADVSIRQVQVIDKVGRVRGIVVWSCGPDIYWSDTMDGLFDAARRKVAPPWLVEQLKDLPQEQRFHSDGSPYTSEVSVRVGTVPTHDQPAHIPSDSDSDLPSFAQA